MWQARSSNNGIRQNRKIEESYTLWKKSSEGVNFYQGGGVNQRRKKKGS